jgi:hypothetical protein
VAFDEVSGRTVCNVCVYEGNYEKLRFTAAITKKLKKMFDDKFDEYTKSVHQMQDISSDAITKNLKCNVHSFFKTLRDSI